MKPYPFLLKLNECTEYSYLGTHFVITSLCRHRNLLKRNSLLNYTFYEMSVFQRQTHE